MWMSEGFYNREEHLEKLLDLLITAFHLLPIIDLQPWPLDYISEVAQPIRCWDLYTVAILDVTPLTRMSGASGSFLSKGKSG